MSVEDSESRTIADLNSDEKDFFVQRAYERTLLALSMGRIGQLPPEAALQLAIDQKSPRVLEEDINTYTFDTSGQETHYNNPTFRLLQLFLRLPIGRHR